MTDVAVLGLFSVVFLTHQLEIMSGAFQITAHIQTVIISVPEIWIRDPLVPCLRVCNGVDHCRGPTWRTELLTSRLSGERGGQGSAGKSTHS